MGKILIFAGTTEGRMLAEYCADEQISADISAATAYGASLLPQSLGILTGKMDLSAIAELLNRVRYLLVIDATHPYAKEATENLQRACSMTYTPYERLLRETVPISGEAVSDMKEMIGILNRCSDTVLSTLGSKSVPALTAVSDFRRRLWVRILPDDAAVQQCIILGYDPAHILTGKGPFSVADNIRHIRQSCARILLTKESGISGGYPEKAAAAEQCGIRMLTCIRPPETGKTFAEIKQLLHEKKALGIL